LDGCLEAVKCKEAGVVLENHTKQFFESSAVYMMSLGLIINIVNSNANLEKRPTTVFRRAKVCEIFKGPEM
jgi:hypothetical protein